MTAPVITCARHRIQSDGQGIATLVVFYGCPLRCQYCINSFSFDPKVQRKEFTANELYECVKIDELYFLATGGGVTFGGGEPLLYAEFLNEFRSICGDAWHLCVETSLSVDWESVEKAAQCIDVFYIDCKDTDAEIYRRYTGGDNALMLDNLKRLLQIVPQDRIVIRLPLIPSYNTEHHRQKSRELFEAMGITNFDEFTYVTDA